jgi:hypothetical protein
VNTLDSVTMLICKVFDGIWSAVRRDVRLVIGLFVENSIRRNVADRKIPIKLVTISDLVMKDDVCDRSAEMKEVSQ